MSSAPLIDLSRNKKQAQYFNDVMFAASGLTPYRFFAYGGSVRGGKTFCTLFILGILCKKFPGSRWHVIRATLPDLKKTTIPSFEKLFPHIKVQKDPGNWHATFPNGSTIYFTAESKPQDPELKSFLGLETNGVFIEQGEEASPELWQKAIERAGSWYIDPMPPAFVFLTFNPTNEWPRQVFYEPSREGKLKAPYYYLAATPHDNPFVTADQWAAWSELDSRMYAAMIEGDWDALISNDGRAYWTFDKLKHSRKLEFDPSIRVLHLTYDQNVVPYITLLVVQCRYKDDEARTLEIRVLKEYCLEHPRATTQAVSEQFLVDWGERIDQVYIYGDASGNKRDTRAAKSDYEIAKQVLYQKTGHTSMKVQTQNPEVRKSVLFLCAIFEGKIPGVELVIDSDCVNLIKDLINVKTDANGGILKEKATAGGVTYEKYGHTSDALRYLITTILKNDYRRFEKLISGNGNRNDEQSGVE